MDGEISRIGGSGGSGSEDDPFRPSASNNNGRSVRPLDLLDRLLIAILQLFYLRILRQPLEYAGTRKNALHSFRVLENLLVRMAKNLRSNNKLFVPKFVDQVCHPTKVDIKNAFGTHFIDVLRQNHLIFSMVIRETPTELAEAAGRLGPVRVIFIAQLPVQAINYSVLPARIRAVVEDMVRDTARTSPPNTVVNLFMQFVNGNHPDAVDDRRLAIQIIDSQFSTPEIRNIYFAYEFHSPSSDWRI